MRDELGGTVEVEFLTGPAGCGKTFEMKRRIAENPSYGILTATTGVAAVNLDTTTVHSRLGYYDTESLLDAYTSGKLHRRLRWLHGEGFHRLVIDEVSMLHARQLDILYQAVHECNEGGEAKPLDPPLGIVITGDFCQLPPVKGEWAFKAECWPEFAMSTTRMAKIWRQADAGFLEALNLARSGQGIEANTRFRELGCNFALGLDLNFDGTTIVSKNAEVDRYNKIRMMGIREEPIVLQNTRWGFQLSDWKNIPDQLVVKPTALVMLLANASVDGCFIYVNGDLAHVIERECAVETDDLALYDYIKVELLRNGSVQSIGQLTRQNLSKQAPTDEMVDECQLLYDRAPYFDEKRKRWVLGEVCYWPMRLGYASTVHKSQGLSLDRVQIDCRDGFFGAPNLAYVALSRARTIAGMRIVANGPDMLARRINLDPEVKEWL
jgi:ATP-dependent DNA helicase PIF1